MEKRRDLITIGELSKLTDVNAKSLRYYEKIGVLCPSYIDSANDYRYYSYLQVQMVIAIQFYVEMGIPLSELHNFIDKDEGSINFREQIAFGIDVAKRKMQTIQNQLRRSEELLKEIDRCDQILASDTPVRCELSEKNCWIVPIQGRQTEQKYYSVLRRLLLDTKESGIRTECEAGILRVNINNEHKCFVFADVNAATPQTVSDTRFFHIPAQTYFCKETPFIPIDHLNAAVHPELFGESVPTIIILSELFNSEFDYRKPKFELRWSFSCG
jgi:DNA-binding transcriptional MerR regulator